MIVAVSVAAAGLDAALDPRFGRAAAFVFVNTETGECQEYANPAMGASGGAGIQAAEWLVKQGAEAVISGAFGPNAYDVLAAAGVSMYRATDGTATELIEKLKRNELDPVVGVSRGGRGRGRGRWG